MRALFTLGVLILLAGDLLAQEKSWIGKTILVKKDNLKIGYSDAAGKQVFVAVLDSLDYRVLNEENGWIRVKTRRGIGGWFDKEDAVLLEHAVAYFSQRLRKNPDDVPAQNSRAVAWRLLGDTNKAMKDLDELIRRRPAPATFNNRGNAWRDQKEYDKALADYTAALRLDPLCVAAWSNRGLAWIHKKAYEKALADLDEALRLDAKYAYAYNHRGLAWFMKKDYDKALADFDRSAALDDHNSWLNRNSAWLRATCPDAKYRDGAKAVAAAKKALELEHNPRGIWHETLAAAHAEAGDFDEAVRWQERALQDSALKSDSEAQRRLALYRQKQPYRQE